MVIMRWLVVLGLIMGIACVDHHLRVGAIKAIIKDAAHLIVGLTIFLFLQHHLDGDLVYAINLFHLI